MNILLQSTPYKTKQEIEFLMNKIRFKEKPLNGSFSMGMAFAMNILCTVREMCMKIMSRDTIWPY